ncbi:MAG: DUF2939 domain-containing protein [Mariprofundus sp.]|nr:DUF2939 domain-containing protein [Mariprofundus sp.]
MAKGQNQNNGLRMVLFYITCGIALVTASYGGLYFAFGHLAAGIENNDKAELEAGINFHQLQGAIRTQLPENLAQVTVDTSSKYANSTFIANDAPRIEVNADTFVALVKQSGICAPAGAKAGYDDNACTMSLESMAYAHLNYKLVNNADKNLWAKFILAKDESIVVWRMTSATLSKPMMAKVLE